MVRVVQPPLSVNLPKQVSSGSRVMGSLREDKGQTKVELKIDKQQYAPGESIKLTCNINNSDCEKSIKTTKVRLIRTISGIDIAKEKSIKKTDVLLTL